jgi:hypothetical protein
MDDRTRVPKLLERLFSAFPTAARADEMLSARTYLEALDGFSVEAIDRSVNQFVRGAVPTHDGRFAPSAAELARNVKQWDDAIKVRDEAKNPPQLASGILSVDFGHGPIDMTKLSIEQQDEVLRTGRAPALTIGSISARLKRLEDA